jgi:chromosome transmission fidelity protein 1
MSFLATILANVKKKTSASTISITTEYGEDQFVLENYESDQEQPHETGRPGLLGLSKETQTLLNKLELKSGSHEEEPGPVLQGPKIFYCSRTHSQLSQFANELKRVRFPPVIDEEDDSEKQLSEELKHLTMGSRKNLCINPKVNKFNSVTAINERCLELQKPGTAVDQKCSFLPNKETEPLVTQFRDRALSQIRDIEDLGSVGKEVGICPYYASRAAVPESEIITLPYPLLLQENARESLGIDLQDHIVVIDEAHNLMDAICGIYSCSITLFQLQLGRDQLMIYLQKFRNKLKGKNRVYVAQAVRLLDALLFFLQEKNKARSFNDGEVSASDLLAFKGVDQINLYKLSAYIQESRLARKVDGYISFSAENSKDEKLDTARRPSSPVLMQIQTFMLALMNPAEEGRFFYSFENGQTSLSYMLLDAAPHFQKIVSTARSVVLVGGTMSPMEDYIHHLFPYVKQERIMSLSCGHIVPSSSLVVYPIVRSARGMEFEFTFEKRERKETIISAGETLLQVMNSTPDGIVVFFPSYRYLEKCLSTWKSSVIPHSHKQHETLLSAMEAAKPLFYELKSPQSTEATSKIPVNIESLLAAYTHAVRNPSVPHRGATLFAILSGSLSEGINFSDTLGRCVVVIGLPFPNPHSAMWKAKRAYIAAKAVKAAIETGLTKIEAEKKGREAAAEFYLNATMRAVNQAVGRAIRHKDDYAAIILIDKRFEAVRVESKLSGWMKESIQNGRSVDQVSQGLKTFFKIRMV